MQRAELWQEEEDSGGARTRETSACDVLRRRRRGDTGTTRGKKALNNMGLAEAQLLTSSRYQITVA